MKVPVHRVDGSTAQTPEELVQYWRAWAQSMPVEALAIAEALRVCARDLERVLGLERGQQATREKAAYGYTQE